MKVVCYSFDDVTTYESGFRGPIALGLLAALLIALSAAVHVGDTLQSLLQALGVGLIVFAIDQRTTATSKRIEDGLQIVKRDVAAAMEPERERLAGITRVYTNNQEALEDLSGQLQSSSRRADLLQFSAYPLLMRNRDDLRSALDRGVHMRLLLLDPRSPFVEFLGGGHENEHVKRELEESVERCRQLAARHRNFDLRFYREPQPFSMYVLDEFAILVPRLPLHTHRGLTMRVERGPVFRNLEDLFETMWSTATGDELQRASL